MRMHIDNVNTPIALTDLKTKYIRIPKKDICYFQFILEGYEGFITATTIDKKRAVVKLFIMPEFQDSVAELLEDLKKVIDFEEIEFSKTEIDMPELKRVLLIILLAPVLMAMGGLTELPADKVPKTERDYIAVFVDQMDVVTECKQASIGGNTFVEGKRGEGNLAVDFEKIKSVVFRMKGNDLTASIKLKDGTETAITVDKDKKAYGRTKFGAFQIRLADLKSMTLGSSQKPK